MNDEHKKTLANGVIFTDVIVCIKKNWWEYYQHTNEKYNCCSYGVIGFSKKDSNEPKNIYPMVLKNYTYNSFNSMEYFEDLDKVFKDNSYLNK